MRVGIVGLGAVGGAIAKLFPSADLYDEPKDIGRRADINECQIVFVCVPTPAADDGSCDTSIVEEVVSWIDGPTIVLRSTVNPGTTSRLRAESGKPIVFQPEYGPSETPDHPYSDLRNVRWVILGGDRADCAKVAQAWMDVYSAELKIVYTTSETAELCKYMENAFLATKVTFCNEFFDIAQALAVDYNELRELWLLDPRIGRTHSFVYPDRRGYGGKCLSKDMTAIAVAAMQAGVEPTLLHAVIALNERMRAPRNVVPLLASATATRAG